MTWIVDEDNKRIIDPGQDYVLVVQGGGSDGSTTFAIERFSGEVVCIFLADRQSRTFSDDNTDHSTDDQKDLAIWRIISWPSHWRETIKAAMLTFRTVNGWQYPGTETCVQFGVNGEPEHA